MSTFKLYITTILISLALLCESKPFINLQQMTFMNFAENTKPDSLIDELSPITSCGIKTDIFIPRYISVTPNPPRKGEKLTLHIRGNLTKPILQGSQAHAKVKLGLIKLIDQDFDFCDQALSEVDITCPVKKGGLEVIKDIDIPAFVPSGHYMINVEAHNPDGERIACFVVDTFL